MIVKPRIACMNWQTRSGWVSILLDTATNSERLVINHMRIVICWPDICGYVASCWRALAAVPDVKLHVIAFQPGQKTFSTDILRGLDYRLLTPQERDDRALIKSLVQESRPDVLYVSGWFHRPYRDLLFAPEFDSVSKWVGADSPWLGTWRQQMGRFLLRRLMKRLDRVFVPGERGWQYFRRIGVPEQNIRRELLGIDYTGFSPLYEQRLQQPGGWPKGFLFLGRYAPEKGLDTLVAGYTKYRSSVRDPWPLGCCGAGPTEGVLHGVAGVKNYGFVQPADLPDVMRRHAVFVLASRYDPWPLVVSEASAAGMPVLCTNACGSSVELVRPYYNGLTFEAGNVDALAQGMRWMHEHWADLPEMGRRGQQLAAPYSAEMFALRWAEAARQCLNGNGSPGH